MDMRSTIFAEIVLVAILLIYRCLKDMSTPSKETVSVIKIEKRKLRSIGSRHNALVHT